MRTIALIFIALTAANASPAFAAEWWLVGNHGEMRGDAPNRQIYFVDRASISRKGSKLLAWTAVAGETPASDGEHSLMVYQRFDCAHHKFVNLKFRKLGADEELIEAWETPLSSQTETVIPLHSSGNGVLKFVCGDRTGNPEKVPPEMDIGIAAGILFSKD